MCPPPPTINLFAISRVFVRFSPNLLTFPKILLRIIWYHNQYYFGLILKGGNKHTRTLNNTEWGPGVNYAVFQDFFYHGGTDDRAQNGWNVIFYISSIGPTTLRNLNHLLSPFFSKRLSSERVAPKFFVQSHIQIYVLYSIRNSNLSAPVAPEDKVKISSNFAQLIIISGKFWDHRPGTTNRLTRGAFDKP